MARLDLTGISRTAAGTWGYRLTLNGRRTYVGKFPSAEDAARARDIAKGQAAAIRGGYEPDPRHTQTIAEIGDALYEERKRIKGDNRTEMSRWALRVKPAFGNKRPADVTPADLKARIRDLRAGLSASSANGCLAVLSNIFEEVRVSHPAIRNPCKDLPRDVRANFLKDDHDPAKVPFLRTLTDVHRVYDALPLLMLKRQFALGVYAGMRPSEARAVEWADINLDRRTINIARQVNHDGTETKVLKSKKSRVVPILDSLLALLREWRMQDGGKGLVVKPPDGFLFMPRDTAALELKKALVALNLSEPGLSWYECTRHTFASLWVMSGRSMRKLQHILGHHSIIITERYAHLDPHAFSDDDRAALGSGKEAKVVSSANGAGNGTPQVIANLP